MSIGFTQDPTRPEFGREIATTGDGVDITRGYLGALMQPFDTVLQSRGGDLRLYEQVLSDPEVKSALAQRQLAVTQCEWRVEAGGTAAVDQAAADHLRDQIHAIGWDNVTQKMLHGVFYGYAVAEMIYKPDGQHVVMDAIKVRNRRRFRYGKHGDLRMLTMHNQFEGIPAEQPYFWDFCTGADHDDEPYGLGLAHWLYWPVFFKRNGIKFWLIFLEKFGMPTAVGEYDQNASTEDQSKLLQACHAIQSDSGIIIPRGMQISLMEAGRNGTADYKTLHDTMNETIQKVVLGQTASTQGTSGRLGNDDLQADVRGDIIKADADLICESFNLGPARWLTHWNFPKAKPPRVYRVTDEAEDINQRAERDATIHGMGFVPSLSYINEHYGEGGEHWAHKQQEPASTHDAEAATSDFADSQATKADPPSAMADQLEQTANRHGADWLAQIRALADGVETIEQLREGIFELLPDLSLDDYATALAEGMAAAHLAGASDVLDETKP